ncbi:DUF317 domain-containing protein [Streptomyces sp. NPDC004788]
MATASACAPAFHRAADAGAFPSSHTRLELRPCPPFPTRPATKRYWSAPSISPAPTGPETPASPPWSTGHTTTSTTGPCQLLVTSPDQRIRIGWFGDDFELWRITAAEDAVATPRWTATFNHITPAEIVAGLTTALAQDYAASDPYENNGRFLADPSLCWADAVQPLLDAGWRRGAAKYGTVEITAPDGLAGVEIDTLRGGRDAETVMLWAGPRGWGTRAEVVFTARTPSHLIAETAAVMASPAPVVRERHMIHREMEPLVTLTPGRPGRRSPGLSLSDSARRTPHRCHRGRTPCLARSADSSRPARDGGPEPHHVLGAEAVEHPRARSDSPAVGRCVGSPARPLTHRPDLPGRPPPLRTTGVPSCPTPPRSTRPLP